MTGDEETDDTQAKVLSDCIAIAPGLDFEKRKQVKNPDKNLREIG